jgi:hypothetical protein
MLEVLDHEKLIGEQDQPEELQGENVNIVNQR